MSAGSFLATKPSRCRTECLKLDDGTYSRQPDTTGKCLEIIDVQRFHLHTRRFVRTVLTLPIGQRLAEVQYLRTTITEPWEIIYFKLYQSQIPVTEKAIETAALMLGSDSSRGYCLEIVCADFLAGANLDNGDPETLAVLDDEILQVSARRAKAGIPWRPE